MKKLCIVLLLLTTIILQYCSTSKNVAKSYEKQVTYGAHVQPIIVSKCTPCHLPPKGRMKAYDNYLAVKNDINSILDRVTRNPGDKGFMPFKHSKLPDSTINVLVQWKKNGMPEN